MRVRIIRESDYSPASALFMLYIKRPSVHKNPKSTFIKGHNSAANL